MLGHVSHTIHNVIHIKITYYLITTRVGSAYMTEWPNILHTICLLYSTTNKVPGLLIQPASHVKAIRDMGIVSLAILGFGFIHTQIPGKLGFDIIFKTSLHK